MPARARFSFGWAFAYGAIVVGFIALVARFYHPVYGFTSFFQVDASNEECMLPELRDRPAYIYRDTGGYDGLYYAQLACRPLLDDPALPGAMDNFGYRARRALGGWIAWLAAGGNTLRTLDTYALLNPACWLVLALVLLAVFPPRSLHDAVAWSGVMLSAGALSSVRLALTDLPALLFVTGGAVLVQRGRARSGVALLAVAGLARETSLLAGPAAKGTTWRSTLLRVLALVAPLAIWLAYVRFMAGPSDAGMGNFDWLGRGAWEKWRLSLAALGDSRFTALHWTTLLAVLALTVQAVWLIVRPAWQNLWWRLGVGYAGLFFFLGSAPWVGDPGAATRILLPLQLAFNALVPRTRLGLSLLVLGNLSAGAGVLSLWSVPGSPHELAAMRADRVRMIAETGNGWYPIEHGRRHAWAWAAGAADLELRAYPVTPHQSLRVSCHIRAFTPRRVTVRQGDNVLWTGELDRKEHEVDLGVVAFSNGTAQLRFTTDVAAGKETADKASRDLAYSVSEVSVRWVP